MANLKEKGLGFGGQHTTIGNLNIGVVVKMKRRKERGEFDAKG